MSLCVHVGIQVGGLFANGPKQLCFEPYVDIIGERSYILFFFGVSSLVQFLYMPATVRQPVC